MKILAVSFLLCLGIAFTGCQTTNPPTREAIVYYTFKTTWDGALESYKAAHKLNIQGKITDADMQDINEAWLKFRASFRLAFVAASKDWKAATPADVLRLRDDLLILISSI